ncbi:TPA: hypothetical protein ACH3X1_007528 [Trebouxia sp. C0004]
MSSAGGLQEKRLSGVVAEQQGKGEQSSSTQELNESNLSLGNQGMACLACLKELHTLSDIPEVLSFLEELELGKASQAQGTSAKQSEAEAVMPGSFLPCVIASKAEMSCMQGIQPTIRKLEVIRQAALRLPESTAAV